MAFIVDQIKAGFFIPLTLRRWSSYVRKEASQSVRSEEWGPSRGTPHDDSFLDMGHLVPLSWGSMKKFPLFLLSMPDAPEVTPLFSWGEEPDPGCHLLLCKNVQCDALFWNFLNVRAPFSKPVCTTCSFASSYEAARGVWTCLGLAFTERPKSLASEFQLSSAVDWVSFFWPPCYALGSNPLVFLPPCRASTTTPYQWLSFSGPESF